MTFSDAPNIGTRKTLDKSGLRVFLLGGFAPSIVTFRMPLIRKIQQLGGHIAVGAPLSELSMEHAALLKRAGVAAYDIPTSRHGINPFYDASYAKRVYEAIKTEKSDVLVPYTIKPVTFGSFGARLAGTKRIHPMVTGLGSAFIGEPASVKGRLVRLAAIGLYRAAFSLSETVYFQNMDDVADLRRLGALSRRRPIAILHGSGIDIDEYAEQPVPQKYIEFLMVARLIADKGLREYAAAARIVKEQHPEVRFRLVGPTDTNPTAISEAEVRSWQWIDYQPWTDDIRPALAACSVYVLPSYREGTPRSVLEAMAVGRAVVTTDAPGCRETVQNEVNGFLVPVKSVRPLADAMLRFVKNRELISAMGKASRNIASSKYDVRHVYDELLRRIGLLA